MKVDPDTRCTYCGAAGHRASRCPRRPTQAAAHALLDQAQAGASIDSDAITAALHATGDLDTARRTVVHTEAGAWDPWRGPAATPFSGLGAW